MEARNNRLSTCAPAAKTTVRIPMLCTLFWCRLEDPVALYTSSGKVCHLHVPHTSFLHHKTLRNSKENLQTLVSGNLRDNVIASIEQREARLQTIERNEETINDVVFEAIVVLILANIRTFPAKETYFANLFFKSVDISDSLRNSCW